MGLKVAIHQPEHFPYVGFFQKMEACDIFVILDDVQFTKNNFQNRNRFQNKNGIEDWFTIPVPADSNTKLIKDVKITDSGPWSKKIVSKLKQNLGIDTESIYQSSDMLVEINVAAINHVKNYLKITTPTILSSSMKISGTKSDRLLNLCKELSATCYISGQGGMSYLDVDLFNRVGINVEVFNPIVKDHYTILAHMDDYESIRNIS